MPRPTELWRQPAARLSRPSPARARIRRSGQTHVACGVHPGHRTRARGGGRGGGGLLQMS
eukprot:9475803-Pyramimonas_sp.AAC.1